METAGEPQPPPQNEDPEIVGNLFSGFVGFLEQYGWFLLVAAIIIVYLRSKFQSNLQQWQNQREAASYKKIDGNVAQDRMEAMQRARLKMQQQLDEQAKEFAEKEQKKSEAKRQEKIEDWNRHQEGKGYRNKTKPVGGGQTLASSSSSPSSSSEKGNDKPQPKKRLRPDFSPLMGDGDVCRYRLSPRGGGASGGG